MQNYNDLFTRQQILDFAFTELDADSIQSYMQALSSLDDHEFSTEISRDFGFKIQTISRNRFTIIY
jgi:DNA repair exonuclease SbcCD ATPase subunit